MTRARIENRSEKRVFPFIDLFGGILGFWNFVDLVEKGETDEIKIKIKVGKKVV